MKINRNFTPSHMSPAVGKAKFYFAAAFVAVISITVGAHTLHVWAEPGLDISRESASPRNLEAELITITPMGFEPEELTRPAGRFLLAFDNESGLRELVFRLEREGGQRIVEMRPKRKSDVGGVMDLPPGLYLVTEANHPEWVFRLRLTNP